MRHPIVATLTPALLCCAFALTAHAQRPAANQPPVVLGDDKPPKDEPPTDEHRGFKLTVGGDDDEDDDNPVNILNKMPPDVRSRLTGDQVQAIVMRSEQQESSIDRLEDVLVPGFFFLSIVGVVVAIQFGRLRRERQLHDTLRAMIERGVDIPPALLVPPPPKHNDRRRGIILVSVGLGVGALLAAVGDGEGEWAVGLVPLMIGVGYLLASRFGRDDAASA